MRNLTIGLIAALTALTACADHPYDPGQPAVDPNAPVVTITTPSVGTFAGDVQTLAVTGTATDDQAVASVQVNGVAAALQADGTWTATVPVAAGTSLLHAVALDAQGNQGQETRAVVAGPMGAIDMHVPNGITATLSAQTFAAIGTAAGNFIQTGDLESMIAADNPVMDLGGGPDCLYVTASITSMTVGGAQIAMVPQTGGLALDGELDNVNIGMHLDYAAACIDGSRDITIAATHVSVKGNMAIGVAKGAFAISFDNPDVTISGLDLELGGIPGDIVDLLDLSDALGPILGWATEKFVVPMVNTAFAGLNETKTLNVMGTMVDVSMAPSQITFSPAGGLVELDTSLRAHGDASSPGFVYVPNQLPAMDLSHGFQLAVADDTANQLFGSMWAAKALDQTIDLKTGPYGDIGQLFDSVELSAAVPPFVDASNPQAGLVLTIGDLMASFKLNGQVVTEVAINAQVGVKVDADMTGALHLDVGTPTTYVDVLSQGVAGANQLSSSQFEEIVSFAASRVIAVGAGEIGAVPLPTFAGVGVTNLTIDEQTGYLVVDGAVQVQ
ncbi:MAG TPA: hypothetical protein VGF94_06765 [Kofleriaceae bacterium]|jgi:hypothetical protein